MEAAATRDRPTGDTVGLFKATIQKLRAGLAKTTAGSTATLKGLLTGRPLSKELLREMEKVLIAADVGVRTAIELRKDIEAAWERGEIDTGDEAWPMLRDQLIAYFPEVDRTLRRAAPGTGPTVILVTGVNGAGKTTSIAKLCKALRDRGDTVLLAACDTFRAAAVEQLTVWAERLDVSLVRGQQGGDPAAVAFDAADAAVARGVDVLIVDTAGRLHTQAPLMDQLAKIRRVIQRKIPDAPHETLLVLDATTGQNGVHQARAFSDAADVTGLVLSKLDGSARGGIVIAVREALNIPVKFIGVGETVDDLEPFEPESFIRTMFDG